MISGLNGDFFYSKAAPDGEKCRSTLTRESTDKIIQIQNDKTGKLRVTVSREVVNDKLVIVCLF
jgi:hypothetical protein